MRKWEHAHPLWNEQDKTRARSLGIASVLLVALAFALFWVATHATRVDLPHTEDPVKFYATACHHDLRLTLERALAQAQHSILIAIFTLDDRHLIRLLHQRAREGTQVTILCDKSCFSLLRKELGNEVMLHSRQGIRGLMHRKLIVVDESQVWIGSANFTLSSLWMYDNLLVGIHSTELAAFLTAKCDAILRHHPIASTQRCFSLRGQSLELWMLPEDRGALQRLLSLIDGAKKTLRIAQFTWTHPQLADAVIAAHRRGVLVEVLIDQRSSQGASADVVAALQRAGICVRHNAFSPLLHHKLVLIDTQLLGMGSANWTRAAFQKNEDCFLLISPLTQEQRTFMETLWTVALCDSTELPAHKKEAVH